jgi:hypothetical protein
MLKAPQPPGGKQPVDDPAVAMQRIIDQAMDLVPPADALTSQDEAALARYAPVAARAATSSC